MNSKFCFCLFIFFLPVCHFFFCVVSLVTPAPLVAALLACRCTRLLFSPAFLCLCLYSPPLRRALQPMLPLSHSLLLFLCTLGPFSFASFFPINTLSHCCLQPRCLFLLLLLLSDKCSLLIIFFVIYLLIFSDALRCLNLQFKQPYFFAVAAYRHFCLCLTLAFHDHRSSPLTFPLLVLCSGPFCLLTCFLLRLLLLYRPPV
jgi:hypothetical protein